MTAIFKDLQGWNSEVKLITPIYITVSHFGTMAAILDFFGFFGGEEGEGANGSQQGLKEKEGGHRPPKPSRKFK